MICEAGRAHTAFKFIRQRSLSADQQQHVGAVLTHFADRVNERFQSHSAHESAYAQQNGSVTRPAELFPSFSSPRREKVRLQIQSPRDNADPFWRDSISLFQHLRESPG